MIKDKVPSFLEYVENIFHTFSQTKPGDIDITFSKKTQFPIMKFGSKLKLVIPLPQKYDNKYLFEGMMFDNNHNGRKNLWCVFFATLYHLASHVCVSKYSVYDQWVKHKTKDVCFQVIDFIEDVSVDRYISHTNPEIFENMKMIHLKFVQKIQEGLYESDKNLKISSLDREKKIENIRTNLMNTQSSVISIADLLYKNRDLLPRYTPPYCECRGLKSLFKPEQKSPDFEPFGVFNENIEHLDMLWLADEQLKSKLLKTYGKYLKDLNFDSIVIPPGNFHNYIQLKEKASPLLKRIRQQLRMVANLVDEPRIDQIGYLNMQMAIQAIASEGQTTDIFERDEIKRVEEAWAILIDKSASMSLRFDQVKEFTICVSESANDLAGKSDAWALFSFDNNFQILKDFKEKYDHEVQARIGSLENNGLSLLPDALELTRRILVNDPRERKYIFVITDGHSSGYERINQHLTKITKKLDVSGISLIAIGVSKSTSKRFRNSVRGSSDLKQLVAKFITAYKTVSSDDM
ncbi:putative von Willebrand factor type A [Nitrosotalea sinensis]|uniref:Putative von Willebrand factor type A n=1 Tax=Nitrosotalea sinensis TaxID=1499975 RepID=A0A2H1EIP0_9ARCH|nr:vWA domain-containing protein [Candidatus Nitrosotalea sinensis]SHO46732.1 putative von Willebrand factor type A [Candidatus Nitrosotalea sinensis]